ncbi:Arv1-like family-domain-containing protein [Mrakia frigida]|uniref:sterol homeostasis protein ARV1 n=1 Tax=Mrakia frigida TaxID=29902 RepID=UPI003FCBFCD1
MPICTRCGSPVPSLFTVYSSASNIRLTICDSCNDFADPYVEQPPLLLFLDLVLLRPGVYRHLLFNRGTEPIEAGRVKAEEKLDESEKLAESSLEDGRAGGRWKTVVDLLLTLSVSTVIADTYLRWTSLRSQTSNFPPSEEVAAFFKLFLTVILETLAFHVTVLLSALILLKTRGFFSTRFSFLARPQPPTPDASKDKTKALPDDFHPLLIPLTLLLSSLPKLLLLLLLSIWPTPTDSFISTSTSPNLRTLLDDFLSSTSFEWVTPTLAPVALVLAQETLDREWVIRNVLGGMGIGFGLRVLLMGRLSAVETTALVCVGWWGRWKAMESLGDERGELKI